MTHLVSKVLVTGATGFVGNGVVGKLAGDALIAGVAEAVRRDDVLWAMGVMPVDVGDLLPTTAWSEALHGLDAVVHYAARLHVTRDDSIDLFKAYREVNVEGTGD